jgi:hypothetical protein
MQSGPENAAAQPVSLLFDADAPTLTDGVAAWSALCAKLEARASLDAEIIDLAGRVQRSGTIERIEGVTLDTALNWVHRMPRAERAMLLNAADVLGDMPLLARLLRTGQVSWGQVRGIVDEAKRLSKAARAMLDERIRASADRFAKLDADDAVDAVKNLRSVERREADAPKANFVWGQADLFGRAKVYSELDTLSFAALFSAVDALTPADDGRSLSQRRADGLVSLALHRCDTATTPGGPGPADTPADSGRAADTADDASGGQRRRRTRHPLLGAKAVPSISVVVDVADASAAVAGRAVLPIAGVMPALTARIMEALARDAVLQIVLVDDGRPLAVSRKIWAHKVPRDIATAIRLRDRGDRFPGSRLPIDHLHHLDKDGQGHDVDALVGLSGKSHRRVHRCQWQVTVGPGREVTFTRGDRSWTTLPRGTRLRHPPPHDDTGDPDPADSDRGS